MSQKHTPGPWLLDEDEFETTIYVPSRGDQREIARVKVLRIVADRAAEDLANATLIATAPDLLVALEQLILLARDCESRWSRGHPAIVQRAEALAEKARGGR